MRKSFWIALAVLFVSIGAPNAHADTMSTFDVSGNALNTSGGSLGTCASFATCTFSGTLTIDVTGGTVTAADITFPGLAAFTDLGTSGPFGKTGLWELVEGNGSGLGAEALDLLFTTSEAPASLVGFTGGSILGIEVFAPATGPILYFNLIGAITPATTATPEPSSLMLMLGGLGALAFAAGQRRVGHSRPSTV